MVPITFAQGLEAIDEERPTALRRHHSRPPRSRVVVEQAGVHLARGAGPQQVPSTKCGHLPRERRGRRPYAGTGASAVSFEPSATAALRGAPACDAARIVDEIDADARSRCAAPPPRGLAAVSALRARPGVVASGVSIAAGRPPELTADRWPRGVDICALLFEGSKARQRALAGKDEGPHRDGALPEDHRHVHNVAPQNHGRGARSDRPRDG